MRFSGLFQLLGFVFFGWRSGAFDEMKQSWNKKPLSKSKQLTASTNWPKVSIVVPARNEEHNLPKLLNSFLNLEYPAVEFVIVDDQSTDRTLELAQIFSETVKKQSERLGAQYSGLKSWDAKVIQNPELPKDWGGKNWACHNGFINSTGDFILFTDADTFHHADSLHKAVDKMLGSQSGLCSAIPYHLSVEFWEKLQGVFQALLLVAAGAFMPDLRVGERNNRGHRLYAIGQYLLFSRKAYEQIGGHQMVKRELVEDVALAFEVAEQRLGVEVLRDERIVDVRMYPGGFNDFLAGWRRNFNWAFKNSNLQGTLEMILVVGWLLNAAIFSNGLIGLSFSYLVAVFTLWFAQRKRGDYPWWSHWLYVFFTLVFCWVSALSFLDLIRGTPVKWRGRSYGDFSG